MSEETPLVLGSLLGVRSFKIDRQGYLRGVTYPQVWLPGTNEAICGKVIQTQPLQYEYGGVMLHSLSGTLYQEGGWDFAGEVPRLLEGYAPNGACPGVGSRGCQCGWYAYYAEGQPPNTFHQEDRVWAVVEGFGRVTVGPRGWRAEKARIVALMEPEVQTAQEGRLRQHANALDDLDRIMRQVEPLVGQPTKVVLGALLAAAGVTFSLPIPGLMATGTLVSLLTLAVLAEDNHRAARVATLAAAHRLREQVMHLLKKERRVLAEAEARWDRVLRRYSVPVYRTVQDALKDFPEAGRPDTGLLEPGGF